MRPALCPIRLPPPPAGSTRKAAELLDQLHASGLVGNQQLYHGLLTSCQAAGDWELGMEVFLGMQVGAGVLHFGGTGCCILGARGAAFQGPGVLLSWVRV